MSSITAGRAAAHAREGDGWFAALGVKGRRAFRAAYAGYNVGRGVGALFPGIIGFLAAAIGLGGAIAFGVFGYVLAICALAFLPETSGRDL